MTSSFHACGIFCYLLITFANSLDEDHFKQHVGLDLDPNCLTLIVFQKVNFEKKVSRRPQKDEHISAAIMIGLKKAEV